MRRPARSLTAVLFWFAVPTALAVFAVFRDASIDYRLVAVGALLPDVVDGLIVRRMGPAHSVVIVVAFLFAVMGATVGHRALRKRLLALPIGMFGHLVLDGAWLTTRAFWWPITSGSRASIPSVNRGVVVPIVEEVLGLIALVYLVRRFKLDTAARRRLFVHTGTLDPRLVDPESNPLRRRVGRI